MFLMRDILPIINLLKGKFGFVDQVSPRDTIIVIKRLRKRLLRMDGSRLVILENGNQVVPSKSSIERRISSRL